MKKLGILLSTPPAHKNRTTAVRLAQEAVRQKIPTYMYLIDDGVYNLHHPEITALAASGVHLFACAYGAQCRGLSPDPAIPLAGLVVLADIIQGCDRFIALNAGSAE